VVKIGRLVKLTTSPPSVRADCIENVVASTSYNPMGPHGLLLYLIFTILCGRAVKSRNVFARSNTGIVGSNPNGWMSAFIQFVLSCVGSVLAAG
jgi:hypothetical protein